MNGGWKKQKVKNKSWKVVSFGEKNEVMKVPGENGAWKELGRKKSKWTLAEWSVDEWLFENQERTSREEEWLEGGRRDKEKGLRKEWCKQKRKETLWEAQRKNIWVVASWRQCLTAATRGGTTSLHLTLIINGMIKRSLHKVRSVEVDES